MHAIKAAPAPLRETRLFFSFLVGFLQIFFSADISVPADSRASMRDEMSGMPIHFVYS